MLYFEYHVSEAGRKSITDQDQPARHGGFLHIKKRLLLHGMCEYFKGMKSISRSVHKIMVATLHPNFFTFLSSRVKVTTKSLSSTMLSLYNFTHRSLPTSFHAWIFSWISSRSTHFLFHSRLPDLPFRVLGVSRRAVLLFLSQWRPISSTPIFST